MSLSKSKLVVAAIDFGTTYSGYAYSFKAEYKEDALKIYANADWTDGCGLITVKAPTIVLFDPDKKFHSFGYEAEQHYAHLSEEDNHSKWRYYRRFKMKLDRKKLRLKMLLVDDQGQKMQAIDVFAASIKYLKEHLMERLKNRIEDIRETDVHWIITVPAIWNEAAKQFMKEAARKAGLPDDQLQLALEPEAAAIYCKELMVSKAREEAGVHAELQSFQPNSQFMILDLGGGTIDITVHEVQSDGTLKELVPPSGGPWGGTLVDGGILSLLETLVGKPVMGEFNESCKADELELQKVIELTKRKFKGTQTAPEKVNMRIPNTIFDVYRDTNGSPLEKDLPNSEFASTIQKKRDRLIIDRKKILDQFDDSKIALLIHVEQLLKNPKLRNVRTLIMVGGFSESEIMSNAVRDAFPNKRVIVPEQAGIAVVKGAVMFGHNSDSISSRKLPYTYGVSVALPFNERIHPSKKKVTRDGVDKCEDIFKMFVRKGTTVVANKTKYEHSFYTAFVGTSHACVEIYKSDADDPRYVDEDRCYRVGNIEITLLGGQDMGRQLVTVVMNFGDTELHVEVKESGAEHNKTSAKFNFLK